MRADATSLLPEFYDEIDELRDLPSPFYEIFHGQAMRRDRLLNWLMRYSLDNVGDLSRAANQGVLLVGHACYQEPILGSEGANHAIEDAIDLADHLLRAGFTGSGDSYYHAIHATWRRRVSDSCARRDEMHSGLKGSF